MKRILKAILLAALLFLGVSYVVGFGIGMLFWIMFGDTHEEFWAVLPQLTRLTSLLIVAVFLYRDLANKTSRLSRTIRIYGSIVVLCVFMVTYIRGEVQKFRGWTSEKAVHNVVAMRFPEQHLGFTLVEEKRNNVSSLTKGPQIIYMVKDGEENICRVEVTRNYWSWWSCGKYEFFKGMHNQTLQQTATSE